MGQKRKDLMSMIVLLCRNVSSINLEIIYMSFSVCPQLEILYVFVVENSLQLLIALPLIGSSHGLVMLFVKLQNDFWSATKLILKAMKFVQILHIIWQKLIYLLTQLLN